MMKTVLLTGALMLLSGCIPAPLGRYYKPLYPEPAATYSGDLCYGQAGAPAVLTVPLVDGVRFTVRATQRLTIDTHSPRQLDLSVTVPAGVRFRFVTPQIAVEPVDTPAAPADALTMAVQASLRVPALERIDPMQVAPTPLTSSQGQPLYTDYRLNTGWMPSWGDGFVPQAIEMTLPTLRRAGYPDLPLVVQAQARPRPERFAGESKGHTSLIYVTPDSDARTAARHRQCLAEGRAAQACDLITAYDDGGFQIRQDDLEVQGRWYVYHVERGTPFRGDLGLQMSRPTPWQLLDNQIRVRNLADHSERRHTFSHLNLLLSYRVPLDSTVYLPPERAQPQKGVELQIRRALDAQEAARYRVTLPDVAINGRRLTLPPIELVRHSLDFGLLPFNC